MARDERTRARSRTRLGTLFRRASRWQRVAALACALVVVHGVYVLFVPGVQLGPRQPEAAELGCPPAVVAALTGKAGLTTPEDAPLGAEAHDAACASTGRWWVLAAGAQIAVAAVWGLAVLEWGRVWRRARRRRRRHARRRAQPDADAQPDAGGQPDADAERDDVGSPGPDGEGEPLPYEP